MTPNCAVPCRAVPWQVDPLQGTYACYARHHMLQGP